jgi:CYTH domain-containing protein
MGTEIERKFLVRDPSVVAGSAGTRFRQGYLSRDPERRSGFGARATAPG